jgi:hypothetical protein
MAGKYHQAEALLALATLGTGSFRTDGGRLDRALQSMGADLPASLKELSFGCGSGSVGLRCYELPDIWRIGPNKTALVTLGGFSVSR